MSLPNLVAPAAMLAILGYAAPSGAQESSSAPVVGVMAGLGTRGGWGGPPEPLVGGGLTIGGRWSDWRTGALGRVYWWHEPPAGVAVDVGVAVSKDIGAIWIDPQLSAAWFVRVEPATFRWASSTGRWAWAPSVGVGARAAGIELSAVGTLEAGFDELPDRASRLGYDVELRLGVDFVELGRLLCDLSRARRPLAP
jgi:hypothetical protein